MWRNIASNALTLMCLFLVLLTGIIVLGQQRYETQGPLARAICLKVERGSNFNRVASTLAKQNAVESASIFRIGVAYSGKSHALKAGSYLVPAGSSMKDIVAQVTQGGASSCGTELLYRVGVRKAVMQLRELDPASQKYGVTAEFNPTETGAKLPETYQTKVQEPDTRIRISFAEGVTSWQIVEALKNADFLTGDVKNIPAEGSLAPNSYEVHFGEDRNDIIKNMHDSQMEILATAWENRAENLPYKSPQEALVMASIVEKETALASERRQVASVFVNRLEKSMRLQTDPTVIYGITKGKSILGRGLRRSELRKKTAYNTYVIDGLPPTPIANPGQKAIEAALNPDDSKFLFFVADGTGGHAFATTLKEHNRNVAKWRKIEAERKKNN